MNLVEFFKSKSTLLLLIIVFIAGFFRFYQLGTNPPSLTWDEVAWGYNAYALGIDGRDEFGRFLPHDYLESFGDFKPPLYAYLDIFPIKLFGLTEFAVRFPSALLGTLTVLLAYFFVKRLFDKSANATLYALATSFILAVSPWHIMLSRAAFEANVSTFFLIIGGLFFLRAVQKHPSSLIFSAVAFVCSLYTFNTARVFVPLLLIVLTVGYWKKLFAMKKIVIIAIVVGICLTLPTAKFFISPQARLRFQEVNIFTDLDVINRTNQEIANDNNAPWSKVLHNRRLAYSVQFLQHYFDNLTFQFLFITGDGNPKFSTQATGQMYVWELPFFIAGIFLLIRKKEGNWWVIPVWLLLGIIPAATARETPHALRIETTLPMFQLLVAYGVVNSSLLVKPKVGKFPIRKFLLITTILFASVNILYFFEEYFLHYAKEFSGEWQYGYKDVSTYISSVDRQYQKVYLTKELGRPYIYLLFYKQYSPQQFRKEADINRDPFGFVTVKSFGKYYFDKLYLPKPNPYKTLYIDAPIDVPKTANVLKKFYLLNGDVVLEAYTF